MKTYRLKWNVILLLITSVLCAQCSDETEVEPELNIPDKTVSFPAQGATKTATVTANNPWKAALQPGNDWCTIGQDADKLNITTSRNDGFDRRETVITVSSAGLTGSINVVQLGEKPEIIPEKTLLALEYPKGTISLKITANVDYEIEIPATVTWFRQTEAPAETKAEMEETICHFAYDDNFTEAERTVPVTLKQKDGTASVVVNVSQKNYDGKVGEEEWAKGDIKLKVKDATATSFHPGNEIEKSFDNNISTNYESAWTSVTPWPVTLTYNFIGVAQMDYLVYHPRTNHTNGNFKEFDLYAVTEESRGERVHLGTYNFKGSSSPSRVTFDPSLKNPASVVFVVKSGVGDNTNGYASCAEMEFYQINHIKPELGDIFVDDIYSQLRADVTQADIDAITIPLFRAIAQSLFDATYPAFRIQEFEPYKTISSLVAEMKTSGYNPYENPTGIYFRAGSEAVIFAGDMHGEAITLTVKDWSNQSSATYALNPGINVLHITANGQGYINYYTDNYQQCPPLKLHIAGGEVTGYFDRNKQTAGEWAELLRNARASHFDIKGNYINIAYRVQELKKYCPSRGMDLISIYDDIVEMEYDLMGLFKYNRVPKNHMFLRSETAGSLHADGTGAELGYNYLGEFADPDAVKNSTWAIAHELGHVNQIRPGLRWIGTTEVTNNIYSTYVQYRYTPNVTRLEYETANDEEGTPVVGGRFNCHLNNGVLRGEPWLFQRGHDGQSDHFVKLVPIWQLMLYYRLRSDNLSTKDWYADICEKVRNTADTHFTNGQHQLNFIMNACDATGENLTPFFEKAGLLKPVDREIDDYGTARITITQSECDRVKEYGSRYPHPESPVINYISVNSLKAYGSKLPVTGRFGQGVTGSGTTRTISHNEWKNVTVFETYTGNELIRIAMAGTGSVTKASTRVYYPQGATRIEAVAWDGTRTLVYGNR